MCGVGNWKCPYKDSFEYYVKLNEKDEIIESNFDGKFKDIKGFKIEKRKYAGCPRFNNVSINQSTDILEEMSPKAKDDFDDLS